MTRLRYANGTALREDKELTVAMIDYFYAKSDWRQNKLFEMGTVNDAVPLILALYAYVQKAGSSCIAPALEGRIVQTPLGPKGGGRRESN